MKISHIYFDVYGTLLDFHSIEKELKEITFDQNVSRLWREKQVEYTRLLTIADKYIPFKEISQNALIYTFKKNKIKYNQELIDTLLLKYKSLTPFQDVLETLLILQKEKIPMSILSNGDLDDLEDNLNTRGMSSYFKNLLSAQQVKKYKIHPSVYQYAVESAGISKENILFVSANPWDILGAKWFGFNTFWLNRERNIFEELGISSDFTGESMFDILKILKISLVMI
jgi:2-haloacid dehalogenase